MRNMSDDATTFIEVMRARNSLRKRLDLGENPSPLQQLAAAEAVDQALDQAGSFKHVRVNMYGVSGNALTIVGAVMRALRQAGASSLVAAVFSNEALDSDYEHVLAVCARWVTIVHERPEVAGDAWDAFVEHAD